jgi:hypothetical protein
MEYNYNQLKERDIASLIERYGTEYLVSSATYRYPVVFSSGIYKVYLIKNSLSGTMD